MNTLLSHAFVKNSSFAPLALRLGAGIIFAAYGAQKLFAWFGGYGLEGTGQFMASLGLEPGYLMALAAGSAEFFGGILLVLGLLTRPVAIALTFTMLVAIVTVHLPNGLFMANNGYAFGLALMVISVSVAVSGAGKLSLDNMIAKASD
ncbi:DoxX family protein [Glaciecola petra]|uniref:DoxX family protein n=1 Tax=Glaciecola petra TaxID=3075602 RepID=A0ABU2ZXD0_9ALTE|nr:DoxX family protein [Aestuariibacter sp. P117]MDT0596077.1 DoxX family protein [Aestuariibacter sp. P117]